MKKSKWYIEWRQEVRAEKIRVCKLLLQMALIVLDFAI